MPNTPARPTQIASCLCLLAICVAGHSQALAQLPKVKDERLGVDVLRLTSGERLYGFLLGEDEGNTLSFAVEQEWLKKTYPKIQERELQRQETQAQEAAQLLQERVEKWMAARPDDEDLIRFLKYLLDKASRSPAKATESSMFMLLKVAAADVRQMAIAAADRRKVGGLAYQHELEDVVTTPASLLQKRLEEIGVDIAATPVDLGDRLPQSTEFTDQQWAAKVALIEYQMRKSLEYQGTAGNMLRVGDTVDPTQLISSLFGGGGMDAVTQLGIDLGLPEFDKFGSRSNNDWKKITAEAEKDGTRGVLISQLTQSIGNPKVRVSVCFLAFESPGKWFRVFESQTVVDVSTQTGEAAKRLRDDPQIKQVLDSLEKFGLGNNDKIDLALRHGAATEQALGEAKNAFNFFLGKHTQQLTGPVIELPQQK